MTQELITCDHIDAYQKDGVVLVKALFRDYVAPLRHGIETNIAEPSEFGKQPNLRKGAKGTFFDDYCNWQRIREFEDAIRNSPAAEVAADLMQSETVQIFHDHVLVKEPGTAAATPWHQDSPYYFVGGQQTISFWTPLDHVKDATLRLVSGSHLWEKPVLPQRWLSNKDFYAGEDIYMPVPDPDAQGMQVLEWEMEPAMRSPSISGYCMAHAVKPCTGAGGRFRFAWLAMMPDMLNAPAPHHHPIWDMAWSPGKNCAKTGFRRSILGGCLCNGAC
jgi:ectoine hydroxylase-related dioxygenase (phytanoyl-CoA dioxygenase family)